MNKSNIISIEGCECQYYATVYIKQCNTPGYHNTQIIDIFEAPIDKCLLYSFVRLTTASRLCDAPVGATTAVHNSPVDTSVVVRERLHQRRVEAVGVTIFAAIVVVAVKAAIVPVRYKDENKNTHIHQIEHRYFHKTCPCKYERY